MITRAATFLWVLGLTGELSSALPVASRRDALKLSSIGLAQLLLPSVSATAQELQEKQRNLSAEQIRSIVKEDLLQRQFLATADFTRSIYDESCVFTDEIDSYSLPKFVKGTKQLFIGDKSHVDLVGEVVATDKTISFRFSEVLAFNLPLTPKVTVTGRVELNRGPDGLITSYREFWDKAPLDVIKTAKLN